MKKANKAIKTVVEQALNKATGWKACQKTKESTAKVIENAKRKRENLAWQQLKV